MLVSFARRLGDAGDEWLGKSGIDMLQPIQYY